MTVHPPRPKRSGAVDATQRAADPLRPEDARVLVFVAAYRAKHGVGPTWREIAAFACWPPRPMQPRSKEFRALSDDEQKTCLCELREWIGRFRRLLPHGLRWRMQQKRSTNVTPEGLRRALDLLRERKAA